MSGELPAATLPDLSRCEQRRALGLWIWSILLIVDAVLLTRRFAGQFSLPVPASLALISTALVAAASWLAWVLQAQTDRHREQTPARRILSLGITLAITIGWSGAISYRASPVMIGLIVGVVLVPLLLAASFGFGGDVVKTAMTSAPFVLQSPSAQDAADHADDCRVASPLAPACSESVLSTAAVPPTSGMHIVPAFERELLDEDQESADTEGKQSDLEDGQTLWLSRRRDGEFELVEGWVRVSFVNGQRETLVHVAFCPPLAGLPEIETEDLDGMGLEIRVAAAFPFGARLSVRRSGPLDENNLNRIGFAACSAAVPRAA